MDVRRRILAASTAALLATALAWPLAARLAPLLEPLPELGAVAAHARLARLAALRSRNYADFEGGNIGRVDRTGPAAFTLQLRSDNDDALPKYWRQWFYARLDDVPTDRSATLTLEGAGQWSYYVPFYSYDNVKWFQFDAKDVTQPGRFTLQMQHRFKQRTVWVARYVPYTYTTLRSYLSRVKSHPDVLVTDVGRTPQGRAVPLLTITDQATRQPKTRVVIHARTHPGEVGSSFLLEGLVDFLLGRSPMAKRLRERLIFTIVPMLNVDGVVAGNNRVSPQGINLEGKWYPSDRDPLALDTTRAPPEVRLFHDRLIALLRQSVPVTMALNLHASAGEPQDNVFIFPHFGPETRGYRADEARLFSKQLDFIGHLCDVQGKEWFNRPPDDGTRAFLKKSVPESWWWRNFKDQVMAVTIESTYGMAGSSSRWVKPDDMRRLGAALGRAIARYHGLDTPPARAKKTSR